MIDQIYLEGAKRIRLQFLDLNSKLFQYQSDISNLKEFLEKTMNGIDTKKLYSMDKIEAKKIVDKTIYDLELQTNSVMSKVKDLSIKIEKIKKEEDELYQIIKTKYNFPSDADLIKEIHDYLKTQNIN
jgi:hypothetical protein